MHALITPGGWLLVEYDEADCEAYNRTVTAPITAERPGRVLFDPHGTPRWAEPPVASALNLYYWLREEAISPERRAEADRGLGCADMHFEPGKGYVVSCGRHYLYIARHHTEAVEIVNAVNDRLARGDNPSLAELQQLVEEPLDARDQGCLPPTGDA